MAKRGRPGSTGPRDFLAAMKRGQRSGSVGAIGEDLAALVLTMDADSIRRVLDELPQPTAINLVEYVVQAEASLSSRHAMTRTALARLGLTPEGSSHG